MPCQKTYIAICLGQVLSLCITGTSSASSALWRHYSISIPFTQNFCNYLLLAIIYTSLKPNNHLTTTTNWQFFGYSFADVQANVLAVLAFQNTSVLSALVLSSWSIPCVMLLSTYFLNLKYSRIHVQSACLCLIGLILLIWGDTITMNSDNDHPSKKHI
ncbi:solute carrier family 35 member SLC35F1/F2/F6 [Cokeromyces recurvatus]|uniref:solute carrier family 35 member SLC35F1/F2/F6 n=1 Tax=Cokeromyces recurvatus TaxID=90255 RepID=UPI00221F732D|nr:solute carrier family 35 member SLC35F1/F2/F6 [Cokeromyces recurvatus]KAI7906172.1 solute carrier family 35 member SLC35F1/F2/F6 [Cokeromyces recurvatus]